MSYEKGREALRQENELLELLSKTTSSYLNSLSKNETAAAFIGNDWSGSFKKLQKLNNELIAEDDAAFEKAFSGEIELLEKFLAVVDGEGFAGSWTELFQKDLEIAKMMLKA
jgi:hypothetical protein